MRTFRARAVRQLRWLCLAGLSCCWSLAAAQPASVEPGHGAQPLVFVVDETTELPVAKFRNGELVSGLYLDLGQELAHRLGREPQFRLVPRKRVEQILQEGRADLLCDYLPAWLTGRFSWSRPFLPNKDLLITRQDRPQVLRLEDLWLQRVGTVIGFAYPQLVQALGKDFRRDDALTSAGNLRKLAMGRVDHAVVNQRILRYLERTGEFTTPLHPPLVLNEFTAQCALSPKSTLQLPALDAAIGQMMSDGSLDRILQPYL